MAGMPPPPGSTPGPPAGTASGTADIGVRIGARLLDVLLVGIPASIVLVVTGLAAGGLTGMSGYVPSLVYSLLWFGYFVLMESQTGATVGKKLLNLRVVTADGRFPSLEAAAKRNVWMLLGLIPLIGGLLSLAALIAIIVTVSNDPDNRGKHDEFAGTGVVRA